VTDEESVSLSPSSRSWMSSSGPNVVPTASRRPRTLSLSTYLVLWKSSLSYRVAYGDFVLRRKDVVESSS